LYRRRAWFRLAKEYAVSGNGSVRILVAHTSNDALETVLMRVLRGAGPCGLAVMPTNRGRIMRPLLNLSRGDVLDYLAEKHVSWREDSTNTDTKYLRNRIRHRLIPLLNELFPQWRSGLASLAQTQSLVADFIADEAKRRVHWELKATDMNSAVNGDSDAGNRNKIPSPYSTDAGIFFAQPAIVREEALFHGIDRALARMPSAIRDCLFNLFAATLLIGGLSSICNLRMHHAVVTGTH
jgi:tRNA(Ile)-lysidine synthase